MWILIVNLIHVRDNHLSLSFPEMASISNSSGIGLADQLIRLCLGSPNGSSSARSWIGMCIYTICWILTWLLWNCKWTAFLSNIHFLNKIFILVSHYKNQNNRIYAIQINIFCHILFNKLHYIHFINRRKIHASKRKVSFQPLQKNNNRVFQIPTLVGTSCALVSFSLYFVYPPKTWQLPWQRKEIKQKES